MRLRDLKKFVEEQLAAGGGSDWRTVSSFLIGNISAVRAAGSSVLSGASIIGSTAVGNATAVQLIDDTAAETRLIAAAFGDDVSAGVEIDLRLREAVLASGAPNLPSINADPAVICELNLPALGTNNMAFDAGDPGESISMSLCVTEIEVRAPGGVWPVGGNVVLVGQLQAR